MKVLLQILKYVRIKIIFSYYRPRQSRIAIVPSDFQIFFNR